jgi:hypothetical protein
MVDEKSVLFLDNGSINEEWKGGDREQHQESENSSCLGRGA